MDALAISGSIFGMIFGLATVGILIARIAIAPKSAVTWLGVGVLAVSAIAIGVGAATQWGGCAKPEGNTLSCANGPTNIPEWRPECRGEPASIRVEAICRGRTPQFAYCERISASTIAQPVNTWTSLAFFVAAALIFFLVPEGNRRRGVPPWNPMASANFFPCAYGSTIALVGFGTVALHASFRDWGGFLDSFFIHAWLLFSLIYRIGRWANLIRNPNHIATVAFFLVVWLGCLVGVAVLGVALPESRMWLTISLGGLWLVLELIYYFSTASPRGQKGFWIFMAIFAFGVAILMKLLSDMLRLICNPDFVIQPHGLWHIFSAMAALFAYIHFREEPRILRPRQRHILE